MQNTINNDLKEFLKSGDKFKLSVLRMLKSALQMEAINKKKETLDDDEVISVIKKQVKQRTDSVNEYEKYNKLDKVEELNKEIAILSEYLPEEISEEKLLEIIDKVFDEIKPTSMKDMGTIMKKLTDDLKEFNADMALVSSIVRQRLG